MNIHFDRFSFFKRGFTLIELLVVISIISMLASLVLVALSSARAKGRDAQRISSIHEIQNLLEIYYSSYGTYPPSTYGQTLPYAWWVESNDATGWNGLASALKVSALPKDPRQVEPLTNSDLPHNGIFAFGYYHCSSGHQYVLIWRPESSAPTSPGVTCIGENGGALINYGNGSVTLGSPTKSATVAY